MAAHALKKTAGQPEAAAETAPEPPLIKVAGVKVDHDGQVTRSMVVRAPEGAVPDDLRSPAIWKSVQASPHVSLRKLDRLLIIGHDESWGVEAIVKKATVREAELTLLKVFSLAAVGGALFNDDLYEVYWGGSGYGVRRKADKVDIIGHGFDTEGQAIAALQAQYPRKAG
jgi:hypothetical protein